MEATTAARLAEIMGALAAGDRAACFALLEEFGGHIRATVRRHLDEFGVRVDAETLSELTISAVLEIETCAGAWRPDGGALPWTWAGRRLRRMVSDHIGQHHDSLDADELPELVATAPSVTFDDIAELDVLKALAADRPEARLLLDALERVTTLRDRAILLAYEAYRADGDPSPANTVAGQFAVSPANARQIVKRAKDRMRVLASGEAEFAGLRDIALLAS